MIDLAASSEASGRRGKFRRHSIRRVIVGAMLVLSSVTHAQLELFSDLEATTRSAAPAQIRTNEPTPARVSNAAKPEAFSPHSPSARRAPRVVRVDFGRLERLRVVLGSGQTPEPLLLNLFEDLSLRAIADKVSHTRRGYALSGHLPDVRFGTWTVVVNGPTVVGRVRTPRAVYAIRNAGPGAFVIEAIDPPGLSGDDLLPPQQLESSDVHVRSDARAHFAVDDGASPHPRFWYCFGLTKCTFKEQNEIDKQRLIYIV